MVTARVLRRGLFSQRCPGCGFLDDLNRVDSTLVAHRHIKILCFSLLQQSCVSIDKKFPVDAHDENVVAIRLLSSTTEMSQTECGRPGNVLATSELC